MLKIGPSGNSASFYAEGYKHTYEEAEWLAKKGLNAFEYSFGRGVNISLAAANKIKEEFAKNGIEISAHAPYYTNFANCDEEMILKSFGYIRQSIDAVKNMGGTRVVFHPASRGKLIREDAVALAENNIRRMMNEMKDDFILCPETMGKTNQIGTVEEIIRFCKLDERLYPCFDFGHINSYLLGGLKTAEDFKKVFDLCQNVLGQERTTNAHIHFSKIMYGGKGEIKHLTFADEEYGPDYRLLAQVIDEYNLTPYMVCESDGTMAEDAIIMKNYLKKVY